MPTFGDASFFIALADPQDPWHAHAARLAPFAEQRAPLHATVLVLAEVIARIGSARGGKAARLAYEAMTDDGVILYPAPADVEAAMRTVLRFDGSVSLADAVTLHLMAASGATDVLSFDKDFDGKGVNRIAAPPRGR